MNCLVSDIMSTNVSVVDADISVEEAEHTLNKLNFSCIPVVDINGKCFGVITAKDILQLHGDNTNLKAQRTWEVCTPLVHTLSPSSTVSEAINLMRKQNIHHVIVTEHEKVVGILSVFDVIVVLDSQRNTLLQQRKFDYEIEGEH